MSPVHFIPPGPLYSLNHSHHHCRWDPFGCHSNFASHPETLQTSGSEDPLPDLHYHCTAVGEPSSVTASPATSLWRMATPELLSNACALLLTHSYALVCLVSSGPSHGTGQMQYVHSCMPTSLSLLIPSSTICHHNSAPWALVIAFSCLWEQC